MFSSREVVLENGGGKLGQNLDACPEAI